MSHHWTWEFFVDHWTVRSLATTIRTRTRRGQAKKSWRSPITWKSTVNSASINSQNNSLRARLLQASPRLWIQFDSSLYLWHVRLSQFPPYCYPYYPQHNRITNLKALEKHFKYPTNESDGAAALLNGLDYFWKGGITNPHGDGEQNIGRQTLR